MGKVQGEGDYASAKKFDDDETAFAKSGRVQQAARDAEPKSQAEADEMTKAEEIGRSRSKGEDLSAKEPSTRQELAYARRAASEPDACGQLPRAWSGVVCMGPG